VRAQHVFQGSVSDQLSAEPLAFATLYLNNTSIGTITNESGEFNFQIPSGEYEVIVQFVGYQSLNFKINTRNLAQVYKLQLIKESQELASVKITGTRDQTWYENLKLFKQYFLGTSENAEQCKILNEKILIINDQVSTATLRVYAREPLQILNPNLGYTIQYSLADFSYNFKEGKLFYAGYPYFKANDLSNWQRKKVEKNRSKAYRGSWSHFIKSVLNNELQEQGFRVMRLYRVPNTERPSDAVIASARKDFLNAKIDRNVKDSLMTNVLSKARLPKTVNMLDTAALAANDLILEENNQQFIVSESLLQIVYSKEKEEPAFLTYSKSKKAGPQISIVNILNGKEKLNPLGDITDPSNMLIEGYMAWEKVGDLMPLNYVEK